MNKPVRVCHFTSVHKSDDVRIFLKECSSLATAGFDVVLVAANCKNAIRNQVQIINVDSPFKGRISRMIKTARSVYRSALATNASIYHFHDPELLPFALKLKRAGKVVIYDVHEDVPRQIIGKYWINKYLRKTVAWVFERYENYVASRLDYIVTATPVIRDRFKKINPACIDVNNFPLDTEIAERTTWADKANEVCYIGGITEIRGLKQLVASMDYVSNGKLHLAGAISPAGFEQELKLIPSWAKVQMHGFVTREQTRSIMKRSVAGMVTFLPLPNHVDAQPNKMFEYMSGGIPVIGSHFPLWKDIIEGNKCGICVDPLNPKEIGEAIEYIITHPKEAEQMGKNGFEAVMRTYNWNAEQKKLVNVYKQFVK